MANPRQRRKAKSSSHKRISHSKKAKRLQKRIPPIRGPKALQDAWDRTKTLRQNYMALGLQHDVNPVSSGGSEVIPGCTLDHNNACEVQPTAPSDTIDHAPAIASEGSTGARALPKGFGRIIRDTSGNIAHIELPNDEEEGQASKRELVIDAPVVITKSDMQTWAQACTKTPKGVDLGGAVCNIVQDLENIATSAAVRERHTSLGERSYLASLMKKYGDDLTKMARDRRLNPEQRTANELRRAILKAGGYGALCKDSAIGMTG